MFCQVIYIHIITNFLNQDKLLSPFMSVKTETQNLSDYYRLQLSKWWNSNFNLGLFSSNVHVSLQEKGQVP